MHEHCYYPPPRAARLKLEPLSLAAYIALYRDKHVSTVRRGTAANINRELEHMQDAWPGRSLRSISKKDIVAVVDKAMKRGPSASVMAWKVAKAFFAWCEARESRRSRRWSRRRPG
jgi:hypothetical protein